MSEPHAHRPLRRGERAVARVAEGITLPRALLLVSGVALVLVLAAAGVQRAVEPATFTSYGRAAWWAVVTVGTVGYGDVVPETAAGRTVAALLILFSLALVPILTSIVVTTLVGRRQREQLALARRTVRETGELLVELRDRLERIERSLARDEPRP